MTPMLTTLQCRPASVPILVLAVAMAAVSSNASAISAHLRGHALDETTPPVGAPSKSSREGTSKARAPVDPGTNPRLQLKLDAEDRRALDRNLKFALPSVPAEGIEWVGKESSTVEALRGRVVVIQSLSVRNNWRGLLDGLRRQLKGLEEQPVVIALHTPEGADKARGALESSLDDWIGIVDRGGAWCDSLGVWKKPVNLVVDRNGVVRYAGLTPDGVRAAVEILLLEKADPSATPPSRPVDEPEVAGFPTFRQSVGDAVDQRGKPIPEFLVETWLNGQPEPGPRLVVVDFWATWCAPCRKMIPHMNALAEQFGADACLVGISDESKSDFEQGCRKQDLKENQFRYALALDPKGRLKSFFAARSIPYCAVISKDGIVRWQGHPQGLTAEVMRTLVEANRALSAGTTTPARRWKSADGSTPTGSGGRASPPPKRRSY